MKQDRIHGRHWMEILPSEMVNDFRLPFHLKKQWFHRAGLPPAYRDGVTLYIQWLCLFRCYLEFHGLGRPGSGGRRKRIHIRINVRLHHANLKIILQRLDGTHQGRRLTGTGGMTSHWNIRWCFPSVMWCWSIRLTYFLILIFIAQDRPWWSFWSPASGESCPWSFSPTLKCSHGAARCLPLHPQKVSDPGITWTTR